MIRCQILQLYRLSCASFVSSFVLGRESTAQNGCLAVHLIRRLVHIQALRMSQTGVHGMAGACHRLVTRCPLFCNAKRKVDDAKRPAERIHSSSRERTTMLHGSAPWPRCHVAWVPVVPLQHAS